MTTLTEIRQLAADVKQIARRSGATGPRSAEGKARSAINAVRHGLSGRGLLLPGEDENEYARRMDEIFIALAPENEAQAEMVALVGDDLWKLSRLERITKGVSLARIEELLNLTSSAEEAAKFTTALMALGPALQRWQTAPVPNTRGVEFAARFRAITDALDVVTGTVPDLPAETVAQCEAFVEQLMGSEGDEMVPTAVYQELDVAACRLMSELLARAERLDAAQQELRKAITEIALPDETELKKLMRYRKLVEEGLLRRLQALDQLRKLSVQSAAAEAGERAREYRVRLRVVK